MGTTLLCWRTTNPTNLTNTAELNIFDKLQNSRKIFFGTEAHLDCLVRHYFIVIVETFKAKHQLSCDAGSCRSQLSKRLP